MVIRKYRTKRGDLTLLTEIHRYQLRERATVVKDLARVFLCTNKLDRYRKIIKTVKKRGRQFKKRVVRQLSPSHGNAIPVFVVGCQRSGTNMVLDVLDRSSIFMSSPKELKYFNSKKYVDLGPNWYFGHSRDAGGYGSQTNLWRRRYG